MASITPTQEPLSARFREVYIGFNALIDRRSAEQLVAAANQAFEAGFREINLCISSGGGLLDHAYYVFNFLDALPVNIITHNTGNIASAANIIFMCGDKRFAVPFSTFFFHQTSYDPPAYRLTEPYLTSTVKAIQYDDVRSATIVADKSGNSVEEVKGWQKSETVLNTERALALGLIHEVRPLQIPKDALFHQVVI
ncbi:MAG: ATP-dependent Clp protease proteolytic subunit [Alphaproteobacteria bacterium]